MALLFRTSSQVPGPPAKQGKPWTVGCSKPVSCPTIVKTKRSQKRHMCVHAHPSRHPQLLWEMLTDSKLLKLGHQLSVAEDILGVEIQKRQI